MYSTYSVFDFNTTEENYAEELLFKTSDLNHMIYPIIDAIAKKGKTTVGDAGEIHGPHMCRTTDSDYDIGNMPLSFKLGEVEMKHIVPGTTELRFTKFYQDIILKK